MKRLIIALCIIASSLTLPQPAFAADALYRMLHADQVKQFQEDQDALLVGQILEQQEDKFKVKVLKLLSGKVSSDTIYVYTDFTYGWEKTLPRVNDYAVFSLKKTRDYYKKAWGIFKTTSGDYNTLKLEQLNAPAPYLLGDLACIQWYVNSGAKEDDFFGIYDARYVRRPNGEEVQIYPIPKIEEEASNYKEAINQIQNTPKKGNKTGLNFLTIASLATTGVLGIGATLYVVSRIRKAR
jgi:hypothetical protein